MWAWLSRRCDEESRREKEVGREWGRWAPILSRDSIPKEDGRPTPWPRNTDR